MSGTDYTLTPSLGLYKPIANADINQWGSHLNLNADKLDALWSSAGMGVPLYWTATGSTTSRSAQDRSAERLNVKDFGARLDGVTNDTAAFQAAYNAAPAGGVIYVPSGGMAPSTVVPTRASGNVLWKFDGVNVGTSNTTYIFQPDGDTVEATVGGARRAFYKQIVNKGGVLANVEINLSNKATFQPPVNPASALYVDATSYPGTTGSTWGVNAVVTAGATGGVNNQDVAVAATIAKQPGAICSPFAMYAQFKDMSGADGAGRGAAVGMEMDLFANGLESTTSNSFNPGLGARNHLAIIGIAFKPTAWLANHAYALNATVQPTTANGFTYVCTTAGTSGGIQPTWPLAAGTVGDGTVTWAYATTLAPQISRAIGIGGRAGDNVTWGSALMFTGACYDAILEFSGATLVDGGVADAAIRLAQEMPIDFTGNLTSAGQNRHTLRYTNAGSGFGRLSYQVSGAEQFACEDIGIFVVGNDTTSTAVLQLDSAAGASRQLRFTTASALRWGILTGTTAETGSSAGSDFTIERYQDNGTPAAALTITRATGAITLGTIPPQAANDAAAAALVPPVGIGGLYRNGSALQVRVA